MVNSEHYSIITTTTTTCKHAKRIALELVTLNLAACVQIHRVCSIYNWSQAIHKSNEYCLTIKTLKVNYDEIEKLILRLSEYNTPQIIQITLSNGNDEYLKWIYENSQKEGLLMSQQK